MRIAQIVLPGASEYERKSRRADAAALAAAHDVVEVPISRVAEIDADVAHVYAATELPAAMFTRFPVPYIASADLRRSHWTLRRPRAPAIVVSPLAEKIARSRLEPLPEAVEDDYFDARVSGSRPIPIGANAVIGSFRRLSTANAVEQTVARIQRFRSDVAWKLFDHPPTPEDLAGVDAWIDPAVDDRDFDGFVAEALVVGLPVVASRTPINDLRLEQGRTGMLVPPRDPNELTHAILTTLFKREVAESRQRAARQTVSKFRARQRLRILSHMYETLIS